MLLGGTFHCDETGGFAVSRNWGCENPPYRGENTGDEPTDRDGQFVRRRTGLQIRIIATDSNRSGKGEHRGPFSTGR